jgi:hypothetical protein
MKIKPFGLLGDLFVRRSRHCYGAAGSNSASKKDLADLAPIFSV